MYAYEKTLSDTDSIYCRERTNSHQSSIFIAQTDGDVASSLFGDGYVSNMDVKVLLSRTNLLLNLLSHFLDSVAYFKRSSAEQWEFSREWFLDKKLKLDGVFKSEFSTFHAQINKETTRTYLKGITSMMPDGGTVALDLRQYLFSGDTLRYVRRKDGVIVITVVGCEGVEEQQQQEDATSVNVDRLSVALKLFAEKRKDDGEGGWFKSGCEVNGRIREYFDPLTKEALAGFGETQITELFIGKKNADGKVEFNPMWSGSNGTGWDHIKIDSADDVKEIVDALIQYKTDAGVVSKFLDKGFARPKGFGPSVVSELLMKFHPESCIKHGQRSHKALEWLGLIDFQWKPQYTSDEFKQVCGAAAKILAKMKAMKIAKKINADGSEDTSPPDYLTVNEFLYFVDTNLEKIKEEVMSKEFKNVSKKAKAGARKLSKAVENDEMLQRLMAALRTKPFAILAGHSGTGKSQLVRRLAYMTCNDEELLKEKDNSNAPGNYCMVQVKPNWHDSTDLLGYYTEMNGGKYHTTPFVEFICKAYAYPETPFFVCLDEMNLAPVEQYFAEFLSAIESYSETTKLTDRLITEKAPPEEICGETKLTESLEEVKKHGLTIPRNLFVVGTVNVDETTCQFSRKVLDRAMTILMTAVSFKSMTEPNDPSKEECLDLDGIKFFLERPTQATLVQGQMDKLDAIQKQVGDSPFAIAYRFANEYALYQSAYQMLKGQGLKPDGKTPDPDNADSQKTAIDHVVLMKLLPRIHGARPEMEVWFNGKNGDANKIGLVKTLGDGQSVDMMKSILARVGEYLSFWP